MLASAAPPVVAEAAVCRQADGEPLTLAAQRLLEGKNASSSSSAYDLVHDPPSTVDHKGKPYFLSAVAAAAWPEQIQKLIELQQRPGAFRIAPHLLTTCNHTVFGKHIETMDALPLLAQRSPNFPKGLSMYCRARASAHWPECPPRHHHRQVRRLEADELFVAVLTTDKFVRPRGALMARTLRQQNASFGIFADVASPGVRALPVTGLLERLVHNKSFSKRTGSVSFIAQKHFELLHTLAADSRAQEERQRNGGGGRRTRWWVIADDDSFLFVGRLLQTLRYVDDHKPLLVGGAKARSHLCGSGLCDLKVYGARYGYNPVVHALAGGVGYAFSDAGLRRVAEALDEGRCLDASLGDIATAGCARVAGVELKLLPGGWMVNDGSMTSNAMKRDKRDGKVKRDTNAIKRGIVMGTAFRGQLISDHKVNTRMALCWAQYGECDPRCDCQCECPKLLRVPSHTRSGPHLTRFNTSRIRELRASLGANRSAFSAALRQIDQRWHLDPTRGRSNAFPPGVNVSRLPRHVLHAWRRHNASDPRSTAAALESLRNATGASASPSSSALPPTIADRLRLLRRLEEEESVGGGEGDGGSHGKGAPSSSSITGWFGSLLPAKPEAATTAPRPPAWGHPRSPPNYGSCQEPPGSTCDFECPGIVGDEAWAAMLIDDAPLGALTIERQMAETPICREAPEAKPGTPKGHAAPRAAKGHAPKPGTPSSKQQELTKGQRQAIVHARPPHGPTMAARTNGGHASGHANGHASGHKPGTPNGHTPSKDWMHTRAPTTVHTRSPHSGTRAPKAGRQLSHSGGTPSASSTKETALNKAFKAQQAALKAALRPPPLPAAEAGNGGEGPRPFIVLKGYHVGSKWFAEAFNALEGCSAYFEFEHCLRQAAKERELNASSIGPNIAPPSLTSHYLLRGCGCAAGWECCEAISNAHRDHAHGRSPLCAPPSQARSVGVGVSFGALGAAYLAHVRAVVQREPRVAIVAHVRTNHVKHGLSFLRTSCDGELNHATALDVQRQSRGGGSGGDGGRARLRVPPALLLLRAVNSAQEQTKILGDAIKVSPSGQLTHVVTYESLQRDLAGEMRSLLLAIGVPHAAAARATAGLAAREAGHKAVADDAMVKAGAEDAVDLLANFEELEGFLRPLSCLHAMLVARGPVGFELRACAEEIGRLVLQRDPQPHASILDAARDDRKSRPARLNASECGRRI